MTSPPISEQAYVRGEVVRETGRLISRGWEDDQPQEYVRASAHDAAVAQLTKERDAAEQRASEAYDVGLKAANRADGAEDRIRALEAGLRECLRNYTFSTNPELGEQIRSLLPPACEGRR